MRLMSRKAVVRSAAVITAAVFVLWLSGVRVFAFAGDSMAPAVKAGDRFVGLVGWWASRDYRRFEMVIFDLPEHSPWAERRIPWMKRLVGLPGEHVELRGSQLWIDGRELDAPFLRLDDEQPGPRKDYDLVLGADEFFVVGDNLDHTSDDSRSFGPLKRSHLKGAVAIVLPAASKKKK